MEIQTASLEAGDRQIIDAWEKLFASPGWALMLRRYQRRLEGTVHELESADSLIDLGLARGNREVLLEIVNLDAVLENEFNGRIADAQADRQDVEEPEWRG